MEDPFREEVVHLIEVRSATWVALAEISGEVGHATATEHDCVRGAFMIGALLQLRVVNDANEFPWALARGDFRRDLALFEAEPSHRRRWRMYDENPATVVCRPKPEIRTLMASAYCTSAGIRMRENLVVAHPLASTGYILTSVPRSPPSVLLLHQSRACFSRDPNDVRVAMWER